MTRSEQLSLLIENLRAMISLLDLDSSCIWAPHFKKSLKDAIDLSKSPLNQNDLAALSSSIRSVYGGMGSFNDYFPAQYDTATGRCISFPWADEFDRLSTLVFDRALALVVREK